MMEHDLYIITKDISADDVLTKNNEVFMVTMVSPEGVWLRNISTGQSHIMDCGEFDGMEFERTAWKP